MARAYEKITWVLWIGLVAALPITSMPLVAKLTHTSSVAPASLLFLGALCLVWLPVYLFKKGTFPFQTKIVLLFLLIGIIASAYGFFLNTPAYKSETVISNVASGLVTLIIGVLFYIITVAFPRNDEKILRTLQVINWSGAVMLGWTLLVTAITFVTPGDTPNYLRVVQKIFSMTTFFGSRAVGFAAEPSWLAHILNMVYLPYWLAASVGVFTAHKWRIWKISFENILLAAGCVVLFLTLSRAGLGAFILALAVFFVKFNLWVIKKISQKGSSQATQKLITLILVIGFLAVYIGGALGCVFVLSKVDPRMKDVFSFNVLFDQGITKYADTLKFGERFTYWQAGWRIFNQYPVLGVGLGNAGFYFPQLLPDNAWNLTEDRNLLYHSGGLLNIKSMWSRILAETGVIGFSVFLLILVVSLFTSIQLTRSTEKMKKSIGWMGICMLVSFIIEGFSVDSFAMPYLWFTLGLIAATWRWTQHNSKEIKDGSN